MKKTDIFWQSYLSLEKEVLEVSKYIYITDEVFEKSPEGVKTQRNTSQLATFSPHIADLLVNCCVQIESISKELYFDLGGEKERGSSEIRFDEDCLKLIDKKWETHKKKVIITAPGFNLNEESNRVLRPLNKAHKSQRTFWERAYQAVKHDRYISLSKASVRALIHSLAALYLLNLYHRNDEWNIKRDDVSKYDFSMGSSIFSVLPPKVSNVISENKIIISESPYVVGYKDEVIEKIKKAQTDEQKGISDYLLSQPEIHEAEFMAQIKKAQEREMNNPSNRVVPIWELAKYRLNKKIPKELSFEERKELLVNSEEWNCWIYQNNDHHLREEQLNEDNIQRAIDEAGICLGAQIQHQLMDLSWIDLALKSESCKVFIPKPSE